MVGFDGHTLTLSLSFQHPAFRKSYTFEECRDHDLPNNPQFSSAHQLARRNLCFEFALSSLVGKQLAPPFGLEDHGDFGNPESAALC
jgi:hypothetical protein